MSTRASALGATTWVIAEGHIPGTSTGGGLAFESHETACLLNTGDTDAHVEITLYFTDREPVGPYRVTVPARRTVHQRFNDLTDPEPVPRDTDYASVLTSDVPIAVQHSRLDSRQAEPRAAQHDGLVGRLTVSASKRRPPGQAPGTTASTAVSATTR